MDAISTLAGALDKAVDLERFLDTAVQIIAVPSRTGEAGGSLDRLAAVVHADLYWKGTKNGPGR